MLLIIGFAAVVLAGFLLAALLAAGKDGEDGQK